MKKIWTSIVIVGSYERDLRGNRNKRHLEEEEFSKVGWVIETFVSKENWEQWDGSSHVKLISLCFLCNDKKEKINKKTLINVIMQ